MGCLYSRKEIMLVQPFGSSYRIQVPFTVKKGKGNNISRDQVNPNTTVRQEEKRVRSTQDGHVARFDGGQLPVSAPGFTRRPRCVFDAPPAHISREVTALTSDV
jgi:hypothetical protein